MDKLHKTSDTSYPHAVSLTALRCAIVAALLIFAPRNVHAQKDVGAAASAFSRAQRLELAGKHARAAHWFELAHEISPSVVALRSALRARLAAKHGALAATHALALLRDYGRDSSSVKLAATVLDSQRPLLVEVRVSCDHPCGITMDAKAMSVGARMNHAFFVQSGSHRLVAFFGDQRAPRQRFSADANDTRSFSFVQPEITKKQLPPLAMPSTLPVSVSKSSDRGGLSPAWFTLSAVATAGLTAATVWSGFDVLDRNELYTQSPTLDGYNDGINRQRRTNVLLGAAIGMGVVSIVTAVVTDWSGSAERSPGRSPTLGVLADPNGLGLVFSRAF